MRWIIGDVHGMLAPLRTLLDAVMAADSSPRFYFAGDYVNRGPESRGVIDLLLELPQARFIRGNHDDIFDLVLHGGGYADNAARGDRLSAFRWFLKHGLDDTFASYGADWSELERLGQCPTAEGLERLVQLVPEEHKRFIHSLPPVIEEEDLFVGHGMWNPNEPAELPGITVRLEREPARRGELLWGRFDDHQLGRPKAWLRTGYFGHTPIDNYVAARRAREMLPIAGPSIVLLDTACALSTRGRLTAFCAEEQYFLQADHYGNMVTGT